MHRAVEVTEIPITYYKTLDEVFPGKGTVEKLRTEFNDNCYGLADQLKISFDRFNILCAKVTFKNGSSFDGITIKGKIFTHHTVLFMGEWILDLLFEDKPISVKEYIENLEKDNSKLRIDKMMTDVWYNDAGWQFAITLDYLKSIK